MIIHGQNDPTPSSDRPERRVDTWFHRSMSMWGWSRIWCRSIMGTCGCDYVFVPEIHFFKKWCFFGPPKIMLMASKNTSKHLKTLQNTSKHIDTRNDISNTSRNINAITFNSSERSFSMCEMIALESRSSPWVEVGVGGHNSLNLSKAQKLTTLPFACYIQIITRVSE